MTNATGRSERRKHSRFGVDEATATLYKEGTLVLFGMGRRNKALGPVDLSEGGARLRTRERLDAGAKVRVTLAFDKFDDKIEALGEVRWSREDPRNQDEYHAGVMFLNLEPGQVKKIGHMRGYFTSPHHKGTSRSVVK